MRRLRVVCLLLMSLSSVGKAFGVRPFEALYCADTLTMDARSKGELRLVLDNMLFLRDNEYEGHLTKGYTLPGYWMAPKLSWQALEGLRVEAGVHMLHYWGARKYPNINYSGLPGISDDNQSGFHCVPIFSAALCPVPSLLVVVGTLQGKGRHALAEPLYNEELNLTADPEAGVQVVWDTRPFKIDTWINWESFIFNDDDEQEKFTYGASILFRPSRRKAHTQWYIPLQALFQHRGGEVNTEADNRQVRTWLNAAAGVETVVPLRSRLPVSLNFEALAVYYNQLSGNALRFDNGHGFYFKAGAQISDVALSAGYWQCHDFISLLGNPHFGAISIYEEELALLNPSMVTGHAEYVHQLGKGFAWGLHADIFAVLPCDMLNSDTQERTHEPSKLSYSFGICFRISPSFLLKQF